MFDIEAIVLYISFICSDGELRLMLEVYVRGEMTSC